MKNRERWKSIEGSVCLPYASRITGNHRLTEINSMWMQKSKLCVQHSKWIARKKEEEPKGRKLWNHQFSYRPKDLLFRSLQARMKCSVMQINGCLSCPFYWLTQQSAFSTYRFVQIFISKLYIISPHWQQQFIFI